MGEEGYESRFVCKLCNKKYPCGKSLGGHMRSHVVANSAEFQEKVEFNLKKKSSFLDDEHLKESKFAESGYGLRENPKKTWRAVDSRLPLPQDRVCKQCGKGFQSSKALCGHMACHSDKDKGMKKDHSWTSVFDSQSDTEEAEERKLRSRSLKTKRYKRIADDYTFSVNNNGSSSVSEIDGQDQDEVAMCLMLLSMDSGNKGGVNSVVESSDNNSVVMETKSSSTDMGIARKERLTDFDESRKLKQTSLDVKMENSDSGYFLDECAKAESDVSVDGRGDDLQGEVRRSLKVFKCARKDYDDDGTRIESRKRRYTSEPFNESARKVKNSSPNGEMSPKKSKFECLNCKKIFKSYQALGGHRPCHKKSNAASYESRDGSGENSPDDYTYYKKTSAKNSSRHIEKNSNSKKNKVHICPYCDRVFKNGQALGGHKRSHYIGGAHDDNISRSPVVKPDLPDLLDLNLPAPEANEDDGNGQFFSR